MLAIYATHHAGNDAKIQSMDTSYAMTMYLIVQLFSILGRV